MLHEECNQTHLSTIRRVQRIWYNFKIILRHNISIQRETKINNQKGPSQRMLLHLKQMLNEEAVWSQTKVYKLRNRLKEKFKVLKELALLQELGQVNVRVLSPQSIMEQVHPHDKGLHRHLVMHQERVKKMTRLMSSAK